MPDDDDGAEPELVLASWPDVELLAVGEWPLSTGLASFTTADLQAACAAARCPSVGNPILKLGHHDPRFDGEPAIGCIGNMRLNDTQTKVLGDYTGMPGWLGGILPSAYPKRSVEGCWNFKCQQGHTHPFVITAVALLGVTPPGVGTIASLNDIADLYGLDLPDQPAPVDASAARTFRTLALGAAMPSPPGSTPVAEAMGTVTTVDDVRREFYEEAPWSQWIVELQLGADGPVLIVIDDSTGQLYRVPVMLDEAEPGEVEFGESVAVLVSYVNAPDQTAEAAAFPAGLRVAASWGSRNASTEGFRAAWDASAAQSNLGDDPTQAQLNAMYALPGDTKTASKLPHHDCPPGGPVGAANTQACSAAIGAINGARGGLAGVSADDKKKAYNHLAAHIRAGGGEAPEFTGSGDSRAYLAQFGRHHNPQEGDAMADDDRDGQHPDGQAPEDGLTEAAGNHGAFDGEHNHPHSAFGSQGDDDTHEHTHRHANDAVHKHVHDPVSAAPDRAPAASTNQGGSSDVEFTAEEMAAIRQRLGKNDGEEVSHADIAAALTAGPPPAPVAASAGTGTGDEGPVDVPQIGDGAYLVDGDILRDYQQRALAGDHAVRRLHVSERDQILAEAIRAGKFPQARLEHYQAMWDRDPDGTRNYVEAMASGLVPMGPALGNNPGYDPDLPGDFEGQSAYRDLYPDDARGGLSAAPGVHQARR